MAVAVFFVMWAMLFGGALLTLAYWAEGGRN